MPTKPTKKPTSKRQIIRPARPTLLVVGGLILVFALSGAYVMTRNSSAVSTTGILCDNAGFCAKPKNNVANAGSRVVMDHPVNAWRFVEVVAGTVNPNTCWPFPCGGTLGTKYQGRQVVYYQLYQNRQLAIAADPSTNAVYLGNYASGTKRQMWVKSGGWRVNVAASAFPSIEVLSVPVNAIGGELVVAGGYSLPAGLQNWYINTGP